MTLISCGEVCERLIRKSKSSSVCKIISMLLFECLGNKQSAGRSLVQRWMKQRSHNRQFNYKLNFNPHPFLSVSVCPQLPMETSQNRDDCLIIFLFWQRAAWGFSGASQVHRMTHYLPHKPGVYPKESVNGWQAYFLLPLREHGAIRGRQQCKISLCP